MSEAGKPDWTGHEQNDLDPEAWATIHKAVEDTSGSFADMALRSCVVVGVWSDATKIGTTVMVETGFNLPVMVPYIIEALRDAVEQWRPPDPEATE